MQWTKFTQRECDLFTVFCIIGGYTNYFKPYAGVHFKNLVLVYKNGVVSSYRREDEYNDILDRLRRRRQSFYSNLVKLEKQDAVLMKYTKDKDFARYTDQALLRFFAQFVKEYQRYFALFTLPKYYGMIVQNSSLSARERRQLEKVRGVANYEIVQTTFLKNILHEVAKRRNVAPELLVCATPEEIKKMITGQQVAGKVLQKRNGFCVVVVKGGAVSLLTGNAARRIERRLANGPARATLVRGSVANKGNVQGTVARVLKFEDLGGLANKIVVTPMTSIKFIPFLKQVKAIVTDEGGIACHAAIISRELGIPCVIGTKVATHVFKDGDIVEVDGERGIVRKVSV